MTAAIDTVFVTILDVLGIALHVAITAIPYIVAAYLIAGMAAVLVLALICDSGDLTSGGGK